VADLLVLGVTLAELKAAKIFNNVHVAQCLNYLKVTGLKVCFLFNFGLPRVQLKGIFNQL